MIPHVRKVLVLGGGSAGFLAAIAIKSFVAVDVEILRSPEIGIIGVGEATTPYIPSVLHGDLRLDLAAFYRVAKPSWKLGIRFLWGPRTEFHYSFRPQVENRYQGLSRNVGFYCWDEFHHVASTSALMSAGRCFVRRPDGFPQIERDAAYHIENEHFVTFLEGQARRLGITIRDDTVKEVKLGERGVAALVLQQGDHVAADLFVDCSGFHSLLVGQALNEPFVSYKQSLFCDRAIVGGWPRSANEPILPYTTAETMQAGWCWQIEHENRINRGYVYCSDFLSDDEATREFLAKCPQVKQTRIVKFVSGRRRDSWVRNVVAVGNASGFVEPLESTSLSAIASEAMAIAGTLIDASGGPITPSTIHQFNQRINKRWDETRDFLALHYRFNTRLSTPFWHACLADVDLAGAERLVEYYQQNGPSVLWHDSLVDATNQFRLEGHWTLLLGQKVRYAMDFQPSPTERANFRKLQDYHRGVAAGAMTCEAAFAAIRRPEWTWDNDFYRGNPGVKLSNA